MKRYEHLLYTKTPWNFLVWQELCEPLLFSPAHQISVDISIHHLDATDDMRVELCNQLAQCIINKEDITNIKKIVNAHFKESMELTMNSILCEGKTALHLAAECGFIECLDYLIQSRVNLNALDGFTGQTALHCAAKKDMLTCIKQLVAAGANVSLVTQSTGRCPLHIAAQIGSLNCIRALLLFHRAAAKPILAQQAITSLNCVDHDGHTPLHLACIDGDVPCVVYLLQCGADPSIVDHCEQDCVTIADKMGRKDIIEVIRVHVASTSPKLERSVGVNSSLNNAQESKVTEAASLTLGDVVSVEKQSPSSDKWVISLCETFVTDAAGRVFVFATRESASSWSVDNKSLIYDHALNLVVKSSSSSLSPEKVINGRRKSFFGRSAADSPKQRSRSILGLFQSPSSSKTSSPANDNHSSTPPSIQTKFHATKLADSFIIAPVSVEKWQEFIGSIPFVFVESVATVYDANAVPSNGVNGNGSTSGIMQFNQTTNQLVLSPTPLQSRVPSRTISHHDPNVAAYIRGNHSDAINSVALDGAGFSRPIWGKSMGSVRTAAVPSQSVATNSTTSTIDSSSGTISTNANASDSIANGDLFSLLEKSLSSPMDTLSNERTAASDGDRDEIATTGK